MELVFKASITFSDRTVYVYITKANQYMLFKGREVAAYVEHQRNIITVSEQNSGPFNVKSVGIRVHSIG
jgi:hypothetical protein